MRVVVNGCFDLFHDGHKYLIETALQYTNHGTILFLINTDSSVTDLKGKDRPIDQWNIRIVNIKDCKSTWCRKNRTHPVTIFMPFSLEEDLERLIDNFKPDIIIKGNDRPDTRTIVGHKKWPILILPRIEGYSTTEKLTDG